MIQKKVKFKMVTSAYHQNTRTVMLFAVDDDGQIWKKGFQFPSDKQKWEKLTPPKEGQR